MLYQKGCECVLERDFHQAAEFFARCLRMQPEDLPTLLAFAAALYSTNRIQPALAEYREALRLSPNNGSILTAIGNCYGAEGDFAQAASYYERALKANPEAVGAMLNLVMLHRYGLDSPLSGKLHTLYASSTCSGRSRIIVCFALAGLYERHGDLKRAYRYYAEGNAAQFSLVGYDEAREFALFEEIETTFTSQFFRKLGTVGRQDTTPIFVIGMPRSGTSLVEQILASHSGVYGVGEVGILPWVVDRLIPQTFGKPFPSVIADMDASAYAELSKLYLELLLSYCPENTSRVVSKTLNNYSLIGMIRLLFPRAPIIHCVRDPTDTCWSVFRQYFGGEMVPGYCYDQVALGRYYRRYQRLMDHWHKVLPGEVYDLRYEELVEEPEKTMRALLEYCGLAWEDRCLAFYRTKRPVATASALQVRQPIYKTSIRSWLPLADELEPLRAALDGR